MIIQDLAVELAKNVNKLQRLLSEVITASFDEDPLDVIIILSNSLAEIINSVPGDVDLKERLKMADMCLQLIKIRTEEFYNIIEKEEL